MRTLFVALGMTCLLWQCSDPIDTHELEETQFVLTPQHVYDLTLGFKREPTLYGLYLPIHEFEHRGYREVIFEFDEYRENETWQRLLRLEFDERRYAQLQYDEQGLLVAQPIADRALGFYHTYDSLERIKTSAVRRSDGTTFSRFAYDYVDPYTVLEHAYKAGDTVPLSTKTAYYDEAGRLKRFETHRAYPLQAHFEYFYDDNGKLQGCSEEGENSVHYAFDYSLNKFGDWNQLNISAKDDTKSGEWLPYARIRRIFK